MTPSDFNDLIQQAYTTAFEYEERLIAVYAKAYERQTNLAAKRFTAQTLTAAWTPPLVTSLTDGMDDKEKAQARKVSEEAALAIAAILAAAGVAATSQEIMDALNNRAQVNFEQEITRKLRKIVSDGMANHLTADEVAVQIRTLIPEAVPASSQMLAQTLLTSMVNERAQAAAQANFKGDAVKTWRTVGDGRVRAAHAKSEGQTVPVNQPFEVGGFSLMYPGDPAGPLRLTARCRCRLEFSQAPVVASSGASTLSTVEDTMQIISTDANSTGSSGWIAGNGNEIYDNQTLTAATVTITVADDEAEDAVEEQEMELDPVVEQELTAGEWKALLCIEGQPTEDGRMLANGSVTWREPPLSLMALDFTNEGGHVGAQVAGRVDRIWRDGNEIWGEGVYNNDAFGQHIRELVDTKSLNGNSIDPAVMAYEIWDRETMQPFASEEDMYAALEAGAQTLTVFTDAIILATTFCPTPAIGDARIVTAAGTVPTSIYTPWSLSAAASPLAAVLSPLLADVVSLYLSAHGAHWNVTGTDFAEYHDLFGEIYEDVLSSVDPLAENILKLGGRAPIGIDRLANLSRVRDVVDTVTPGSFAQQLADINDRVIAGLEQAFTAANDANEQGIANFLAERIDAHQKWQWQLRASLGEDANGGQLTASAAGMAPLHPPRAWFAKPKLSGPTGLTITDEGQVFGHAALFNSCHIGEPSGPGVCVPPPRSQMNYEIFHHGVVRTAEGDDIPVGQLTLGTLHAGKDASWRETIRHYEHSGLAFADVHAYEDDYGIVVAGALRPDVPAAKVREARAGALSGDWRQVIGRGLEFIAALVVNVPGFPIPRPSAAIVASASGEEEVFALVAAGMVEPAEEIDGMSRREYLRKVRTLTADIYEDGFAISAEQRRRYAESGVALPDGSFPIPNCDYAERAIHAQGRAKDKAKVVAHIKKRVRVLGCKGDIFDKYR